jgi:hypothetical protein
VVVYREPGREAPLEVRLVSWRDHYVGLWVYDAQGRRTYDLDMRLLDDPLRLLRRYSVGWYYTGPEMAEFGRACPRITVDLFPDGGPTDEGAAGAGRGLLRPEEFLGGTAVLPNGHVRGLDDDSWLFLCQFPDRGEEPGDGPFFLNFGYGSGFIFISPDHREGRFLADST